MVRETVDTRQHQENSKPTVLPLSSSRAPGSSSAAAAKPSPVSVSAAVLQSSTSASSEGRGGGGRGEEGGGGGERGGERGGRGGEGGLGLGGGDTLLTTLPNSSFMGTLTSAISPGVVAGGSHVMSHDQNDDVFSPCSTDDEHMKHIEKVSLCLSLCCLQFLSSAYALRNWCKT